MKNYLKKTNSGEIIDLVFWGYNENKQLIFGQRPEFKEWFTGEIERFVGKILPVNVIKQENGKISFLVENKICCNITNYQNSIP